MKQDKSHSLYISNLFVSVEGKEILHGVSLEIKSGEVHAIMGPNGSGKSTLAYALMGHPGYECRMKNLPAGEASVECRIGKVNILELPPEERAKAGLFLAFQSPIAIPGVTVMNLIRTGYQEIHKDSEGKYDTIQNPVLARRWQAGDGMTIQQFTTKLKESAKRLRIDENFLSRGIHEGFSGGEKKKLEMLQALMFAPKFAIFDEIDTGLDVDALKIVAEGLRELKKKGTGVIIITHYQRILSHITPDFVHILVNGNVVESGGHDLAKKIEEEGYASYIRKA